MRKDEERKETTRHLVVGGEAIDCSDQIIHEHGVEKAAFQELLVPPVTNNDLVRSLDLETDLKPFNKYTCIFDTV